MKNIGLYKGKPCYEISRKDYIELGYYNDTDYYFKIIPERTLVFNNTIVGKVVYNTVYDGKEYNSGELYYVPTEATASVDVDNVLNSVWNWKVEEDV